MGRSCVGYFWQKGAYRSELPSFKLFEGDLILAFS